MNHRKDADVIIIGGGFFGCCLALFLRTVFDRVILIDEGNQLLTRASQVNQARIHSGFHYPRSFVTALRSRILSARFARDFPAAVCDDFRMLYAIARRRSKVSSKRFLHMFRDMDAAIAPAGVADAALFNRDLIESVFDCAEFAFDWTVLREHLTVRLEHYGIDVRLGETARRVTITPGGGEIELGDNRRLTSTYTFNVTYGGLNRLLRASGFDPLPIKYELAEIALITPPAELSDKAVTVMDGYFFSLMPYPSEHLYSLTHVRYTPHMSWIDRHGAADAYALADSFRQESRWVYMQRDAERYLPCMAGMTYRRSIYDVKTVLTYNERNDGRPILVHRHGDRPFFVSIMGAKIDNIYDLFEVLPALDPLFANAHDGLLVHAA